MCIRDSICKSINAGGDKPKNTTPNETETNLYPVIANGLHNDGIVGYSSSYEVDEECLTLSGRGTIGFPIKRLYKFTPIVRLLVIKPLLSFVDIKGTTPLCSRTSARVPQSFSGKM